MSTAVTFRDNLSPALAAQARKVADPRPILEAMALQMKSITDRSFNEPGQRVAPWAALKARTLKEKLKAGKSTAILKRDVVLARSWRVANVTKTSAQVLTDRPYALPLQTGSKRGLPARPMLPFVGSDAATATLAPFAGEKIRRIGQAKLDSLLRGASS